MAQLGTLWFDSRIQDNATSDAKRIRKELYHTLGNIPITVRLDDSNLGSIRNRIAQTLSSQSFHIKVDIDPASLASLSKMGGLTEAQAAAAKAAAEAALAEAKLNTERERTRAATANAEKAELNLARARERASQGISEQQRGMVALRASLNSGLNAVSSMTDAMVGLYSIHTARQFLQNIIDIGGQLEKQRISMGAILGDTARANTLFNQIKQLALKSPFGVVELDQYSKQLAAYGIEQSELFDMTKRLADISAGAGQDIGRLALALGHVKSATYLTGITLRQFSMNNIPMLKMLADYYSEVEKRAVSTAEVQKRISARQVSYEDVAEQIKRMTDAGGMFYNMQEKISESVSAKWKNLKDSLDIMYGELAESEVGNVLKGTATALMALTTHWQELLAVLGGGVGVWGAWRVSVAAMNLMLGTNTMSVLKTVTANKKAQATLLQYAFTYRKLSAEEAAAALGMRNISILQALGVKRAQSLANARKSLVVATRQQSIEEMRNALNNKKIIAEDLAKAVALGKVSKARAMCAVRTSTLTAAEKANAIAAIQNVRAYKLFGININWLTMSFGRLAVAMKSIFLSPQLWVFALISAIGDLWMRNNQEAEKAIELNNELFNRAEEGLKNIKQMAGETGITFKVNGKDALDSFGRVPTGVIGIPGADSIDGDTMSKNIDTWTEFIKNYAGTPNLMLNAAFATNEAGEAVHSLSEQYTILGQSVMVVMDAYNKLPAVSQSLNQAIEENHGGWLGGMFKDDLMKDIKDYNDALLEQQQTIAKYYKQYRRASESALLAARSNDAFAKAIKESGIAIEDANAQIQLLANNQGKFPEALAKFEEGFKKVSNIGLEGIFDSAKMQDATAELEKEFDRTAVLMRSNLESRFGDFEKMSEQTRAAIAQAIVIAFSETVTKAGASVDQVKDKVMSLAQTHFPEIPIDVRTVEARANISAIQEELNKLVGGHFLINIDTATDAFDVIQKIREEYKKCKDQIENAEPILMKLGLTADGMALMSDAAIEQYATGANGVVDPFVRSVLLGVREAQQKINHALTASASKGFTLEDKKKSDKSSDAKKSAKQTDEALKKAQTQFDELKSFLDEYRKYSKTYSKEESINLLEPLFPTMKGRGKDVVDNFKAVLTKLRESLPMSSEERKKFGISIDKYIADFNQSEAEKELDKQLKEIQEYVSQNSEKYNLFKTLFEKTGDKDFASLAFSGGKIFDDLAQQLAARLQELVGDTVVNYDMSDVEAQEYFKDITGAYEIWKKIVELTTKNYQDALTQSADAQAKMLTNEEKIAILTDKIAKAEADTSGIDHSAEVQQWTDEILKLKSEMFEMLPIYEQIFGDRQYKGYKALKQTEEIIHSLIKNAKAGPLNAKTGRPSYYSSFYLDGGEQKQVTITRQQLEKLKQVIDSFQKDERKANPFKALADGIKDMWKKLKDGDDDLEATSEDWRKLADQLGDVAKIVGDLAGEFSKMFEALGNEDMAESMSDIEAGMSSLGNISSGFANGGIVGGIVSIASEAARWITRLADRHDRKLDKAIQKSAREVKVLQNAYKNLSWEIEHQLSAVTKQQSTQMLKDLEASEREMEHQLEMERRKKKDDPDKIIDLEQSIEEAKQQIRTFYEDIGKERYGLDLDSWAGDLASAIVDAFAAGEDAAEAFDKKVADIMKDVVSNIIKIQVVKPAMEGLQKFLFGTNGKGGIVTTDSAGGIEITASEAIGLVSELSKLKSQIDNGSNIYSVVAEAMKSLGLEMDGSGSSSSVNESIKGLTEETADLLSSYINAIRADVSVNRELLLTTLPVISVEVQRWNAIAQQQVAYQEQTAANTFRNAEAADMIYDLLHRVELGGSHFNIK